MYAVGVSNKNEVLLWKSDGSKSSSYIGCLGGTPGFGRALAGGKVNRDDDADRTLGPDDEFSAPEILGDFRIPVRRFFE